MFVFSLQAGEKAKISKSFSEFKFKDYLNHEISYFNMSLEIACFKAICLHHLMVLGAYCKWVFVSVLLLSFWWVGLHTQDIYLLWCFYRNFFHNASQSPIKAEVTVKEPSLCSGQHLQDMDRLSLTMNWFKIRCFNFVQQAKCFYTDQKNIGLEFLSPCGFIFF